MWTELDDVTTTIFNRQIYICMYFMWIIKKWKTIMLQTYSKKINIKMYETSLLLIREFLIHYVHCYYWFENFTYTTHYYWFEDFTYYMRTFYKYKLKANTCTISPNYNTPVCAHNPTSKASAKTPTPRKAQQL